jgi:polar amino acid transport system substrate-binding protein
MVHSSKGTPLYPSRSKNRSSRPTGLMISTLLLVATGCSQGSSSTAPAFSESIAAAEAATSVGSDSVAAVGEQAQDSVELALKTAKADSLNLKYPGKLTVCSDIPYAPFEYYGPSGELIGIDTDMINAIAAEANVKANFVKTPFDTIFDALAAGNCDMIASSVSISEERKERNDFSNGYFTIQQTILVRAADAALNDLTALSGKLVGAQAATTGAKFAADGAITGGYLVREFSQADEMIAALKAGEVDAAIQDSPINGFASTQSNGELVVSKVFDGAGEEYGFVVPKTNPALTAFLNTGINDLIANGKYIAILQKYLGAAA